MSVSGTPVTTYDDGFPKAHPSLPPSTRRSSRGVVHRRTLVELTDDHGRTQACRRKVGGPQSLQVAHERLATRVVAPPGSPGEGGGGGGGALGNPSSYVVTGVPATDRRAVGQTVRSGFPRPHPPHPPGGSAAIGRHSFQLRHYERRRYQSMVLRRPSSNEDLATKPKYSAARAVSSMRRGCPSGLAASHTMRPVNPVWRAMSPTRSS